MSLSHLSRLVRLEAMLAGESTPAASGTLDASLRSVARYAAIDNGEPVPEPDGAVPVCQHPMVARMCQLFAVVGQA